MDVDISKEVANKRPPDIHLPVPKATLSRSQPSQRAKLGATRRHLSSSSASSSSSSSARESHHPSLHSPSGPLTVPRVLEAAHGPPPAHSRAQSQAGILSKFQKVIPVAAGPPQQDLRDAPLDLSCDTGSSIPPGPPPAHDHSAKPKAVPEGTASSLEAPLDLSVKKRPASQSGPSFLHEPAPKRLAVESYASDQLGPSVSTFDAGGSAFKTGGSGRRQGYESRKWVSSYGKPKITPVGIATATAHSYEKLNTPSVKSAWAAPLPPAPGPSKNTSPLDDIPLSSGGLPKVMKQTKSSATHVQPVRRRSPILPVGKYAVTSTEHPPEVVNVRGKAFKVSTVRPQVNGQPVITSKTYNPIPCTTLVNRPFSVGSTPDATMGVNATIGSGPLGCLQLNSVSMSMNVSREAAATVSSRPLERTPPQLDEPFTVEAGTSSTALVSSQSSSSNQDQSSAEKDHKDCALEYQAPLLNIPKFRPSKKKSKKSTNVQVTAHIPPDLIPEPVAIAPKACAPQPETPNEGEDRALSPACVSISTQTVEPKTFNYPPPDEPVNFNDLYPWPSRTVMCARKSTTKPSKRLLQQYLELRSPSKLSVMNHGKKSSSSSTMDTTSSPHLPSPSSCLTPSLCGPEAGETIKKEPNPAYDPKRTSTTSTSTMSTEFPSTRAGPMSRESCEGFMSESKQHSVNKREHSLRKSVGTDTEPDRVSRRSQPSSSTSSSSFTSFSACSASSKSPLVPLAQWDRSSLDTNQAEKSAFSSASPSSSSSPVHVASTVKPILSKISFEPLVINMDDSCDSQASSSCASSIKSGVSKSSASAPEADTGRLLAQLLVARHKQSIRFPSPGRESPQIHGRNSPQIDQPQQQQSSTQTSDVDLEVDHSSSGEERMSRPSSRKSRSGSSDASQGNIFENIRAMATKGKPSEISEPEIKDELSLMCFEEMSPESAPTSPSRDSFEKTSDNSELSFKKMFNRKVLELSSDAESKDIPDDTTAKEFKSEGESTKCYPKVANLSAFMSTVENKLVPLHYATIRESIYAPSSNRTTSPVPIENTRFYQANILRGSLNRSSSSSALDSMTTCAKLEPPARTNSLSAASTPTPSPTPEDDHLEDWQREHIRYKRHKLRMPPELIALPKTFRKGASKKLSPEGMYDYSPSTQYGKAKACISADTHTPVLTPIRSLSTTSVKGLQRLATLDAALLRAVPKTVRTVADYNRARGSAAAGQNAPDLSKEFETDPMETWTMVKEVSPRKPVSPAAAAGKESSGTLVTVLRRERSRDESAKSPVPFNRRKSIDAQFLLAKPSTSKQDPEPAGSHSAQPSDTSMSPKPKLTFTYNEGKPVIKISHPKKKSSKSSKQEKHRRFSYTIKGDPVEPPSDPRDPCSPPPKLSPIRLIASPPRKSKKSSRKSDTPPATDSSRRPVYPGSATIPDLTRLSPDPLPSKVKADANSDNNDNDKDDDDDDDDEFPICNIYSPLKPSESSRSSFTLPSPPQQTSQKPHKDIQEQLANDSPPKIPKLEPEIEKKASKRQRSPIKMMLKSKEVLLESDKYVEKKPQKSNQSDYTFPLPHCSNITLDGSSKDPSILIASKTPQKTSSPGDKHEKKLKKMSKKHKKSKKRDGSKERFKDGEGKKVKKVSGEKDVTNNEQQHKVKKSSKKKKKSDKKESGESRKRSSASMHTALGKHKSNEKSSAKNKSNSQDVKEKSKRRVRKDRSTGEGETSAERRRRFHKRMKARNLGKKIKQAEEEREEEQKRKKKRRSLLDELTNSDGYVADKRLEERKSKDLFADPSKLGREERALLRAMMQFSEMEQVSEIDHRSEDRLSEPEGSKRQDATSAVRKAQALRKSALKRARSKKGVSARKKFDDFVPEILSTRTRRQTADKKNQPAEPTSKISFPPKTVSATKCINQRKLTNPSVKEGEKPRVGDGDSGDHSGRWEILSDDDQKPSPESQKCQVSPNSGLTLTIQWKPRPSEEKEEIVRPEPIAKKSRTPESKRRKARSRRTIIGSSNSNLGDDDHPADLRHDSLDLDIPLASLRDQMCAPSPVPSVTSYTTVSTSCTDELPVPECVKKMSVNQNTGETILHKAARLGYEDVARFCAQTEYLDLDARDHAGYTAMHECCSQGHLEVTKLLIDGGASVNIPSCDGMRPLHDAVENDLTEMVRLLLSRGADPKVATYSGKTVLGLTKEKEMLSLLTGYFQDLNGCRQPQPEIPWSMYGSSVCEEYKTLEEGQGMDVLVDPPEDDLETMETTFEFSDEPMIQTYFLPLDPVKGATNFVLLEDVTDHVGTSPEVFLQEHFTIMPQYCTVDYITSCCTCLCPTALNRLKTVSEKSGDRVRLVEYTDEIRSLLNVILEPLSKMRQESPSVETTLQHTSASSWQEREADMYAQTACKAGKEAREEEGDLVQKAGTLSAADSEDYYDWNEQFLLGTRGETEEGRLGLGKDAVRGEESRTEIAVRNGKEEVENRGGAGGGGGDASNAIYKGLFLHGEEDGDGEEDGEGDQYFTAMYLDTGSAQTAPNKNNDDIHFKKPY